MQTAEAKRTFRKFSLFPHSRLFTEMGKPSRRDALFPRSTCFSLQEMCKPLRRDANSRFSQHVLYLVVPQKWVNRRGETPFSRKSKFSMIFMISHTHTFSLFIIYFVILILSHTLILTFLYSTYTIPERMLSSEILG